MALALVVLEGLRHHSPVLGTVTAGQVPAVDGKARALQDGEGWEKLVLLKNT